MTASTVAISSQKIDSDRAPLLKLKPVSDDDSQRSLDKRKTWKAA